MTGGSGRPLIVGEVLFDVMPDGTRVRINFEDNAIVTVHGVEWLYPINEKILRIR